MQTKGENKTGLEIKTKSGALFSEDRTYRYALWRVWDFDKPFVMFIGLNPSTANEETDDPTIRRVKRFAKDWGYGGVIMCNLFALVTPYPDELKRHPDPLGANDSILNSAEWYCSKVVFAWGNFEQAEERAKEVEKLFPDALALCLNKNGSPRHPLYAKSDIKCVEYQLKRYGYKIL